MRRIGLVVVLALSLVLAPHAAEAQQVGKLYRIGILVQTTDNNYRQAILQGLRERGYVSRPDLVAREPLEVDEAARRLGIASTMGSPAST